MGSHLINKTAAWNWYSSMLRSSMPQFEKFSFSLRKLEVTKEGYNKPALIINISSIYPAAHSYLPCHPNYCLSSKSMHITLPHPSLFKRTNCLCFNLLLSLSLLLSRVWFVCLRWRLMWPISIVAHAFIPSHLGGRGKLISQSEPEKNPVGGMRVFVWSLCFPCLLLSSDLISPSN